MNPSELQPLAQNKTRVLLFGLPTTLSAIVFHILDFHSILTDIITESHTLVRNSDFILLESDDISLGAALHPNIVFLGSHSVTEDYRSLIENISQGGILIFPEFVEQADKAVLMTNNYFRRMPYQPAEYQISGNHTDLTTPLGNIPVPFSAPEIFHDLEGARLFAQQMGIMEDEFYEALMNFHY